MKPLNLFPAGAILAPLFLAILEPHSLAQARAEPLVATSPELAPDHGAPSLPAGISREMTWTDVIYDEPGDGLLWARGASWKASFGAEGVVYYPRAGMSEPRRLPHALSPDLVTVGGESFHFERATQAVRSADRVELDRGLFTERYDLATETVEQSFVFDSLPRAGDLVLRIPVASDLCAVETDAGLEFRSDAGRLTYSRAVAIDARGRRTPAATHMQDGAITIRIAADVLADAAFPLVIDPVLGAIFPDSTTSDTLSMDAAYDPFNQVWVVAYEFVFSAADHDVVAKMYNNAGTLLAQNTVDATTDKWVTPRLAVLGFAHKFLVVAGSTAASNGAQTVRGRIIQPNGTLLTMDLQISISGPVSVGTSCVLPDVGGDSTDTPGSWCVVYQRDVSGSSHTVDYCLVSVNGTLTSGPNSMPQLAGTSDGTPSVSKSSDANAWLVTWEHNFSLSWTIQATRISPGGTILDTTMDVAGGTLIFDPVASSPISGTNLYAIVYQSGLPVGALDSTIVIALIDGGTVVQLANLMTLESSATASEDQIEPSVDSDGRHFLVSYSEFNSQFAHFRLYVTDLAVAGNTLVVRQNHLEPQPGIGLPCLRSNVAAARATTGAVMHRYLVAYDITQNGVNHDVAGRFIDSSMGGPFNRFCPGDGSGTACPCGNSGTGGRGCANSAFAAGSDLQMFAGPASTLADSVVMRATNVPPGGPGMFFQGTAIGAAVPFGDGLMCTSGSIVRIAVKTANAAGFAFCPEAGDPALSVSGGVPVEGGLRAYQFWYRDAASFCTSAVFNLSSGLALHWAR